MSTPNILKHVRFSQTHIDILDSLIENKVGINNYAEAIRYAVLCLEGPEDVQGMKRKMNAMSKNIDILVEMTSCGFHESNVRKIGKKEDSSIYHDAKKNVEDNIQRATTKKSPQLKLDSKK